MPDDIPAIAMPAPENEVPVMQNPPAKLPALIIMPAEPKEPVPVPMPLSVPAPAPQPEPSEAVIHNPDKQEGQEK